MVSYSWLSTKSYSPQYLDSAHTQLCNVTVNVKSNVVEKNELKILIKPNPFNPSTLISFPNKNLNADIYIYDIKGREVKRFTNLKSNRVSWDASSLSTGIYQVRVSSSGKLYTKTITLIK